MQSKLKDIDIEDIRELAFSLVPRYLESQQLPSSQLKEVTTERLRDLVSKIDLFVKEENELKILLGYYDTGRGTEWIEIYKIFKKILNLEINKRERKKKSKKRKKKKK